LKSRASGKAFSGDDEGPINVLPARLSADES
jgi:hypothetical protein